MPTQTVLTPTRGGSAAYMTESNLAEMCMGGAYTEHGGRQCCRKQELSVMATIITATFTLYLCVPSIIIHKKQRYEVGVIPLI